MKTPFNNIAYSGASAPVRTFFARSEMIDCIRAHRSRTVKTAPVLAINIPWPSVCFSYSAGSHAEYSLLKITAVLKFTMRFTARATPSVSTSALDYIIKRDETAIVSRLYNFSDIYTSNAYFTRSMLRKHYFSSHCHSSVLHSSFQYVAPRHLADPLIRWANKSS